MTKARPDITVIVNLHNEGLLAHSSVRSVMRAKTIAADAGLAVEILLAQDRADAQTRAYTESVAGPGMRVLELDVGDLALARNNAVEVAEGRYIAFLDGDDIWSENWLLEAHIKAVGGDDAAIWHPEANLYFGDDEAPYWMRQYDSASEQADWTLLALRNHWTSLSFAHCDVYKQVPYKYNDLSEGFGYEDWSWNAETLSVGFAHKVVPGTIHMIRMKPRSLGGRTDTLGALPTPSDLFRERLRRRTTTEAAYSG